MLRRLKEILKYFLLPTVRIFNREICALREDLKNELRKEYEGGKKEMLAFLNQERAEMTRELDFRIKRLEDELKGQVKTIISQCEAIPENLQDMQDQLIEQLSGVKEQCEGIDKRVEGFYWESRDWKRRTMKLPILSFEVHLAEHCNLNCRGCDHFCPLAKPAYTDLNVFQRDFKRLSELFHMEAGEIHLLGGEPLLNPQVEEFCKIARKNFPKATINIITNGILLPEMPDSF